MRLRDPKAGTVVRLEGALAARYLARGWVDADKPVSKPEPVKPPAPAKPATAPRRGRPPKAK